MGDIDLDPASSELANQIVDAAEYYTKDDDGLQHNWYGRVWLNPPYAQPLVSQFCETVVQEYKDGNISQACVLTNNATETSFGQRLLSECSAVCFPSGRIRFIDKNGNPSGAPLQGQMVVYLGKSVSAFHAEFEQFGIVVSNE
jgi:ParB family chromosome partitioning protein